MKNILITVIGLTLLCNVSAQDSVYYWYKGKKQFLEKNYKSEFVVLKDETSWSSLHDDLQAQSDISIDGISNKTYTNNLIDSSPITYTWSVLKKTKNIKFDIELNPNILYSAPFLTAENGKEIGLSNVFYVKLQSADDYSILQKLAAETNVEIFKKDRYMPLWFSLSCSKESQGNSLEMANYYYESGQFEAAEPNFIGNVEITGVDDPYFDDQWGLENTGQYNGTSGIDINISEAWDITYGDDNITVAVIDQGIDTDHPDLTNLSSYSYDTKNDNSPSVRRGRHGMSVSGIISANVDNDTGMAGIASGTQLMTISDNISGDDVSDEQELAAGINYAVNNGADVINCSWIFSATASSYIDDAIDNALDNGRGGKGCVVVFAVGNDDSSVRYPANSNPDIVTVGAVNQIGKRKTMSSSWDGEDTWGSNWGQEVDLAAPGVLIPTLDLQSLGYNPGTPLHVDCGGTLTTSEYSDGDYTMQFNGTSSAAPHVAGVAALVLSANNGLTFDEVSDIMESTAQKVGSYTYHTQLGRPNGLWHQYVGYGLVDAGASVESAVCEHLIESTTYTSDITIDGCNSVEMEDISVEKDAILTIENVGSISIDGPFEAEIGTQLVFDP